MRKVSIVIQFLLSRRPNHHSGYSYERSLDSGRLRRALQHSQTNGILPIDLRRISAFGSDWWRGKVLLAFRLHTASPDKDRPRMQVFQRVSGSPNRAYPDPHCLYVECRPVNGASAFDLPRVIW